MRHNRHELRERLPEFLVFGSYPEVIESPARNAKIEIVTEIARLLPAEGHPCLRPREKLSHAVEFVEAAGVPGWERSLVL